MLDKYETISLDTESQAILEDSEKKRKDGQIIII